MRQVVVLNVVGLTPAMIGPAMPRLSTWASSGRVAPLRPSAPAVASTAQATYLTGMAPAGHGVVGNGWYDRAGGAVRLGRPSSRLVQAPPIWRVAGERDDRFSCASLFWGFAVPEGPDVAVAPRLPDPAAGRRLPEVVSQPSPLAAALEADLGAFPHGDFWGPEASIRSSRWIAEAAKRVDARYGPTLTLVHLPHLDLSLQRLGPHHPGVLPELSAVDALVGDLIDHYEARGARVVVLSEYGVSEVTQAVPINRVLRREGLLAVQDVDGHELLDPVASRAFAVADHQVAHLYVREPADVAAVQRLVAGLPGVEAVLDAEGKEALGLGHGRSGELVAIARRDAWFSYYYWLDDRAAPDFARTVDLGHKPGYDPAELFWDPGVRFPRMRAGWTHLKHHLGIRSPLEGVPLDASLVRGSHGRPGEASNDGPLLITQQEHLLPGPTVRAEEVFEVLLAHLDLVPGRRAA